MKIQRKAKRTDVENFHLTSDQIYQEWLKSPTQPTETFGVYIMQIADKVLQSPHFRNYDYSLKEDLRSEAILKCLKNYKNLKPENRGSYYGYLYQCCTCAILTQLTKYYKHKEMMETLTADALAEFSETLDGDDSDEL